MYDSIVVYSIFKDLDEYSYSNYSVNGTGILQVLYRYFEIVIGLVSILVFT